MTSTKSKILWIQILLLTLYLVFLVYRLTGVVRAYWPEKETVAQFMRGNIAVYYHMYGSVLIALNGFLLVERNTLFLKLTLSANRSRIAYVLYGKAFLFVSALVCVHGLIWYVFAAVWHLPAIERILTLHGIIFAPMSSEILQMYTGGLVISTFAISSTLLVKSRPVLATTTGLAMAFLLVTGGIPLIRGISIVFPRILGEIAVHVVPIILHTALAIEYPCLFGSWAVYQTAYVLFVGTMSVARFNKVDL